jgi:hypothetical protein
MTLWTSNPARLLMKGPGGFDSHILPPTFSRDGFLLQGPL